MTNLILHSTSLPPTPFFPENKKNGARRNIEKWKKIVKRLGKAFEIRYGFNCFDGLSANKIILTINDNDYYYGQYHLKKKEDQGGLNKCDDNIGKQDSICSESGLNARKMDGTSAENEDEFTSMQLICYLFNFVFFSNSNLIIMAELRTTIEQRINDFKASIESRCFII